MRARRGKIPEIDFELGATVEGSSEIGAVRLADGLPDFEGSIGTLLSLGEPAHILQRAGQIREGRGDHAMFPTEAALPDRQGAFQQGKGFSGSSLITHHTRKVRQGNRHVGMTRTQRPLPDAHGAPVLTTGRDVITKSGVYNGEVLHHTGDQVGPGVEARLADSESALEQPPGCLQISETQVRDCQIAEIAGDLVIRVAEIALGNRERFLLQRSGVRVVPQVGRGHGQVLERPGPDGVIATQQAIGRVARAKAHRQ